MQKPGYKIQIVKIEANPDKNTRLIVYWSNCLKSGLLTNDDLITMPYLR